MQLNGVSDEVHTVAAVLRDREASLPEGSAARAAPDAELAALHTSLDGLKRDYDLAREALATARAAVDAARSAEHACRQRLLNAFESWLTVQGPLLHLVCTAH